MATFDTFIVHSNEHSYRYEMKIANAATRNTRDNECNEQ